MLYTKEYKGKNNMDEGLGDGIVTKVVSKDMLSYMDSGFFVLDVDTIGIVKTILYLNFFRFFR